MKGFTFLLKHIMLLVLVAFGFISLYWAGILPAIALQVLLNSVYLGLALGIFADIMMNAPAREKH